MVSRTDCFVAERIRDTLEDQLSEFFDVWQPVLDHISKHKVLSDRSQKTVCHPSVLLVFIVGVEVIFLLLQCNLLPCLCVLARVVALSVLFSLLYIRKS